jgi:hypothetical protein
MGYGGSAALTTFPAILCISDGFDRQMILVATVKKASSF